MNVENILTIRGNGTYKLPLIFDGDKLLELPRIEIKNPTVNMGVDSAILHSILQYNSKELQKGSIVRPVQKLYYVDEKGAITFTTGACVNNFVLEKPISVLLNSKLVKLFKLFKEGSVDFTLGYDAISDDTIQTKVKFENANVSITSILSCDDTLLRQVPVAGIRGRAEDSYENQVNINKDALIQTINRLMLFIQNGTKEIIRPYSKFEFKKDENGNVIEVYCEYDPESKSGMPGSDRKVKGTLHWLSCAHCLPAEVRLYDRLFSVENPSADVFLDPYIVIIFLELLNIYSYNITK